MKTYLLYSILSYLFLPYWALASEKASLSGKVRDKTGQPIVGASIYISDLKIGGTTDVDGKYVLENLPTKKVLIQVSFIGYKSIIESVDLNIINNKDFIMEESVKEMNEIIVTGVSQATEKNRAPTPISIISPTQLREMASVNIIDAIASQPGVSQITTGSGISKPVIRGLGYNRVVVVNDGIRQEGQQWGDEHGIEIDEASVNKVEILKGAASLAYGSDAIAGVINMLSAPTLPEGKIEGNLFANYQTNNGLIAYSANTAGNIKGIIWDLRYSNKIAHAYQNKYDGYVFNSGFRENALSGIIGVNKSWGYSHLHISAYYLLPGIVEGERDSVSGEFIKPIAENDTILGEAIASHDDLLAYTPSIPYQQIKHYKAVLNNSFYWGKGDLKITLGFQQNHRQEYADALAADEYELYFLLNTINYAASYTFAERNNLSISIGTNGMQQSSYNKGEEFLVPEYDLFDIGIYAVAKKSFEKLDISGGIRFDSRTQNGKDLFLDSLGQGTKIFEPTGTQLFKAFHSTFAALSGSLGASYQFSDQYYAKANISRGFRAPSIGEVGANGEHEGTSRYEIGDPTLKAETSIEIDGAFGMNTEHISIELDIFSNNIDNFIYQAKLNAVNGGDSIVDLSNPIPTFKFTQGNATLTGGEVTLDVHPHPLDWLHFENSFSYVQSIQKNVTDSTKYLPFTPAPKVESELKANAKKIGKFLSNAYIKIGIESYFTQHHFYAAYGTETATPGYTLLHTGIGTDFINKGRTLFSLYINVNNITNVAYQSHLSRLKYTAENYQTARTGVYNMGRNISFKMIMPITLKK